ncbi:heme utilization cystosolic carrier protein HutX [Iodobacter sp.]|uniref:heme utilization cystosolic carrier protein HutX n=1 Tax=Iodobacter sp. TaxID=1915058 RepID=UPI0025E199EA|nr:heme utilization cystosolic carrier protein HutX [Iodobacter sp.]
MNNTQQLRERLSKNPGVVLEGLALSSALPMSAVIESLPVEMWQRIAGSQMAQLLLEMAGWGDVTVIMHSADVIMEFTGPIPLGELSHGFFNLPGPSGLHGHLRVDHCGAIYAIERPFMGRATASVLFTNHDGGVMFKVFLGRDSNGHLSAEQLLALKRFFTQK